MSAIYTKGDTMRMGRYTVRQLVLSTTLCTGLVLGSLLSPQAATAATYYVATNGSDANPGIQAQPFQTIKKGLSVLHAGDTLYLRGGTYNERIDSDTQTIPSGTAWNNAVTIAAYSNETVTLRPNSGPTVITLNGWNASATMQYIIFDKLIIDATNTRYGLSWVSNHNGFEVHHIRFQNGEIKNSMGSDPCMPSTGTDGVNVQTDGHDIEFLNSKSYNARCSYGFYLSGHHILLDHMQVYNNNRYGIQIYSYGSSSVSNNIVRNSQIYGNGYAGITVNTGSDNQVYNNLFYNNAGGIELGLNGPAINFQAYNNTIYNNAGQGIQLGAYNQGAKVQNNIVYQNSGGDIVDSSSTGTTLRNNLTTNPKFIDASTNNFHLQATSPAINAGITLSAAQTDLDGIARPQGALYDIGAYEYPSSSQLPAPKNFITISVKP
jgi:hypothetical protein